jgi:hypothetical protein
MISRPVNLIDSVMRVGLSYKRWFLALVVASTGFDVLQIRFSDNGMRVSYLFYAVLAFALLRHLRFPRVETILIALFCAASFAGMLLLGPNLHSVLYIAWVVFSYGVIYPLFYYFARNHRDDFIGAIVIASRAQIAIGLVIYVTHLQPRAALLYYEPSYFAYGLIPYASITIWKLFSGKQREAIPDLAMLVVGLIETGSATLLCAMVVVWVLSTFVSGLRARQLINVSVAAGALLIALYAYSLVANDLLATTIRTMVTSPNKIQQIMDRGGNRIPRLLAATYVFNLHPLLGVGIGQYRNVSNAIDLSSFSQGNSYLSAQNNEAINIYVELLATTGIPTASIFFLFLIRSVSLRRTSTLDDRQKMLFIALTAMLFMLNFEANYLRPYMWMLLGAYAGIVKPPQPRATCKAIPLKSIRARGTTSAAELLE